MMMPYSLLSFGGLHTDYSKKIVVGADYRYEYKGNYSALSWEIKQEFLFDRSGHLRLELLQITLITLMIFNMLRQGITFLKNVIFLEPSIRKHLE